MKKKLIVAAISSALVAPSAFAAQDDLGMQYTSAAEGFYGSLRARWSSNAGKEDTGANFDSGTFSRLGVRGTNDLGGGMEGYYQVEFNIGERNGDVVNNRLRVVGLRGGFGAIEAGTIWDDQYNFVTGSTDLSPFNSGRYAPNFRVTGLQYRTPDLNGFQGSLRLNMDDDPVKATESDGGNAVDGTKYYVWDGDDIRTLATSSTTTSGNSRTGVTINFADNTGSDNFVEREGGVFDYNGDSGDEGQDGNNVDSWSLSAKYAFQGFTVAGNYQQTPDGLGEVRFAGGKGGAGGEGGRGGKGGAGGAAGTVDATFTQAGSAGSDGTDGKRGNNGSKGSDGASITLKADDHVFWAVGLSYGQDNWTISGWYGENDARTAMGRAGFDGQDGHDGLNGGDGGNGASGDDASRGGAGGAGGAGGSGGAGGFGIRNVDALSSDQDGDLNAGEYTALGGAGGSGGATQSRPAAGAPSMDGNAVPNDQHIANIARVQNDLTHHRYGEDPVDSRDIGGVGVSGAGGNGGDGGDGGDSGAGGQARSGNYAGDGGDGGNGGDGGDGGNGGHGTDAALTAVHDETEEIISIAASVDVDKVTIYGIYEQVENVNGVSGAEKSGANVGVLYRLGSNTNTWIEYVAVDDDTESDEDDTIVIGFRHNF